MKRMTRIAAWVCALSLAAAAAEAANLYDAYRRRAETTIRVSVPTDGSGESRLDAEKFKRQIEEALAARKSVRFRVVGAAEKAELVVDVRIDGYLRTDHDPVDMLVGTAAIAMDIARQEPYVRLDATVTVASADAKTLWTDRLTATITGSEAAEATAAEAIGREFAGEFVSRCFGKKRPR